MSDGGKILTTLLEVAAMTLEAVLDHNSLETFSSRLPVADSEALEMALFILHGMAGHRD